MQLCPNRGKRRRPGPEERLVFLLLLPQQLMLSGRMAGRVTWPREEPDWCWTGVRQITCGSTIRGNVEAVLLMLYQICLFLLCHKEAKAARLSTRGSPAVLTGWRGNRWQTHIFHPVIFRYFPSGTSELDQGSKHISTLTQSCTAARLEGGWFVYNVSGFTSNSF